MLLANRLVAKELSKRDVPALFRVHEDPSQDKVQSFAACAGALGVCRSSGDSATPQDLQNILKAAAGKPEAQLISTLLLRSLKTSALQRRERRALRFGVRALPALHQSRFAVTPTWSFTGYCGRCCSGGFRRP